MSYNFVDLFNNIHCLNDSSSAPASECTNKTSSRLFLYYGLIPAILITFLFALTKKRRDVLLSVFWGRPGVVYAMDSMSRHSRISYACAFGASAVVVYRIVFGQAGIIDYNGSVTSFLNLIYMFVYGMTFLPVFVSLTMGSVFGYGLGAMYVWMLTAGQLYELAQCYTTAEGTVLLVFRNAPHLLCLLYLSISIPLRFVRFVHDHRPWFVWTNESSERCDSLDDIRKSCDGNYVADIFTKPKQEKVRSSEGNISVIKGVFLLLIQNFVYKRKRGFRYPSRLLSILFLTAVVAYIVAFEGMTLLLIIFMVWKECVEKYSSDEEEKYELSKMINVLIASSILSTLTAAVLFIFSALGILTNYRNHVIEMYKGKVTSIPRSEASPATDCTSYIKYGGYQAAYLIWAFLIQFVILFLLYFFFGYLILRIDILRDFLDTIWPYLLVFIIVNIGLWILSKFLFLQENGSYLALTNRGLLFNCVYFVTFYFLFLGLFSLLLRLFISLILGVIYLGRLDKTIMVKNFEVFDLGFNTYVGFMKTDCAHSHPVLIVFTRLMLLAARSREVELPSRRSEYQALDEFHVDDEVKHDSLARRRWHLLYTLHCNPTLCNLRKGHVATGSQSLK